MGENAELEKRAVEALQQYRDALARAEELEREEAAAREDASKRLNRFATADVAGASKITVEIVQADQAAIARLNEIRLALSRATAALDSAYRNLAALDKALGYIPASGTTEPNAKSPPRDPGDRSGLG